MRQKLILYEMNYHVPYYMRCTCQAQRDAHLKQHEMYISCIQSLLFQEKKEGGTSGKKILLKDNAEK